MTAVVLVPARWQADPIQRRWVICFAIVLALHALPALVIACWLGPVTSVAAPPPAAVMVDLTPLVAERPADPSYIRAASEPRRVQSPAPPKTMRSPKLPVIAAAAATLPAADAPPQPPRDRTPEQQAPALPPLAEPPARPAAPAPGGQEMRSGAAPNWQGSVLVHLEQFKRYPAVARFRRQQGVAYVRFTIDRGGKVLSARIERTSGYDLLDQETLALIQRAQPLPKPPPEVPGERLELVAPVEFFLQGRE